MSKEEKEEKKIIEEHIGEQISLTQGNPQSTPKTSDESSNKGSKFPSDDTKQPSDNSLKSQETQKNVNENDIKKLNEDLD
jgi:hypothetical protein